MEPRPSTDEALDIGWGFTDSVKLVWTTVFPQLRTVQPLYSNFADNFGMTENVF